ncbi:hypothetical protein BLNAU_19440 [Blattamonas nauphoetae]|uniref:RRM domain-containing protein n=1 Tax=Blattamonas nauphoetae TaxID=2049346 RepID=A0ABQ9X231_9EUKA|nr:hypothetical protein BLNAU_19440 [Blattamonas nauphoetae]
MVFFSRFGKIESVRTIPKQNAAFVNFEEESVCSDLLHRIHAARQNSVATSPSLNQPLAPASPSFHLSLPSAPTPISLTTEPDVLPLVSSLMSFGFGKETDAEALVRLGLVERSLFEAAMTSPDSSRVLVVRGLPSDATEPTVHSLFGVFGAVDETVSVAVLNEWHVSFCVREDAVFAFLSLDKVHFGKHQLGILFSKADPTPLSPPVPRPSSATTLHSLLQTWRSSPPPAVGNPLNVDMAKIVDRKVSEILSRPPIQHITLGEVDVGFLMKSRDPSAPYVIWKLYCTLNELSAAEANDAVLSLAESERPPIPTCHPSKLTPTQHAVLEEWKRQCALSQSNNLSSLMSHTPSKAMVKVAAHFVCEEWCRVGRGSRQRIPLCALLISLFIEFLFFRGQLLPFVEWILHASFKETVERREKEGVLDMVVMLKREGMLSRDDYNRLLHSTQHGLSTALSSQHRQKAIHTQTAAVWLRGYSESMFFQPPPPHLHSRSPSSLSKRLPSNSPSASLGSSPFKQSQSPLLPTPLLSPLTPPARQAMYFHTAPLPHKHTKVPTLPPRDLKLFEEDEPENEGEKRDKWSTWFEPED